MRNQRVETLNLLNTKMWTYNYFSIIIQFVQGCGFREHEQVLHPVF